MLKRLPCKLHCAQNPSAARRAWQLAASRPVPIGCAYGNYKGIVPIDIYGNTFIYNEEEKECNHNNSSDDDDNKKDESNNVQIQSSNEFCAQNEETIKSSKIAGYTAEL